VIHLDIKPDNVMFSKSRNKMVFIDFGLSKVIEEGIGFKTFTSFRGTPQYVSKEMLKLFSIERRSGYVDLYYNDLIGLKTTLEQLSSTLTEEYKLVQ
jgi:serine/threonine protein kinase